MGPTQLASLLNVMFAGSNSLWFIWFYVVRNFEIIMIISVQKVGPTHFQSCNFDTFPYWQFSWIWKLLIWRSMYIIVIIPGGWGTCSWIQFSGSKCKTQNFQLVVSIYSTSVGLSLSIISVWSQWIHSINWQELKIIVY